MDRLDLGWQVVEAYELNELTSTDKDGNASRRPKGCKTKGGEEMQEVGFMDGKESCDTLR